MNSVKYWSMNMCKMADGMCCMQYEECFSCANCSGMRM